MPDNTPYLERPQFFDGQHLFASDLQRLEAFHREMRQQHNRSLHQPGIGKGFAVSGEKGDRQVVIQEGYAIDCQGRELVLTHTHVEPIPPVASEPDGSPVVFDLAIAYPSDDQLEAAETRAGICQPRGVVRLQEKPLFCWVRLKKNESDSFIAVNEALRQDLKNGCKVTLARLEILHCQLHRQISIQQRRSARPAQQPRVACGRIKPDWRFVDLIELPRGEVLRERGGRRPQLLATTSGQAESCVSVLPVNLEASIDTRQACFAVTPCYSAHIVGQRIHRIENVGTIFLEGLINLIDVTPKRFKIQVLLLGQLLIPYRAEEIREVAVEVIEDGSETEASDESETEASDEEEAVLKSLIEDWTVTWMGVEG